MAHEKECTAMEVDAISNDGSSRSAQGSGQTNRNNRVKASMYVSVMWIFVMTTCHSCVDQGALDSKALGSAAAAELSFPVQEKNRLAPVYALVDGDWFVNLDENYSLVFVLLSALEEGRLQSAPPSETMAELQLGIRDILETLGGASKRTEAGFASRDQYRLAPYQELTVCLNVEIGAAVSGEHVTDLLSSVRRWLGIAKDLLNTSNYWGAKVAIILDAQVRRWCAAAIKLTWIEKSDIIALGDFLQAEFATIQEIIAAIRRGALYENFCMQQGAFDGTLRRAGISATEEAKNAVSEYCAGILGFCDQVSVTELRALASGLDSHLRLSAGDEMPAVFSYIDIPSGAGIRGDWRTLCYSAVARAAFSVGRYIKVNGEIPRALDEVGSLFADPGSATSLRYEAGPNGVRIWSIGLDGVDNGGYGQTALNPTFEGALDEPTFVAADWK